MGLLLNLVRNIHLSIHGIHPERGLAAFPQNIVCARNFCNYPRPDAPHLRIHANHVFK